MSPLAMNRLRHIGWYDFTLFYTLVCASHPYLLCCLAIGFPGTNRDYCLMHLPAPPSPLSLCPLLRPFSDLHSHSLLFLYYYHYCHYYYVALSAPPLQYCTCFRVPGSWKREFV
ncbi:hypothetical protein BDV37DRAFT_265558 [Aspergillus pseudonomiae]|uniref:Uncharacterized protein n=1 Tax=Aspergillus pseudonomiae TaxID=1506151 RepID=A0A5N7CUT7_9EURO|nr:uncharacterized protein BDV37DRAFT_265558 [Aspergillus pseudonomiae]KAE8397487.1 hypothetical protein BDV37DRAFT_265558 [Aspergillus pseudonomiae]